MLNLTTIKLALLGVAALAIVGAMTVWYVQKERAQAASVEALARADTAEHIAAQMAANFKSLSEMMAKEVKIADAAIAGFRAAKADAAVKAAALNDAIKKASDSDAQFAACMALPIPGGVLNTLP